VILVGVAALAACLVAVSTAAARVWGHAVGGVISAFPLIVGPVLLLTALRQDAAAAADTAVATLLGLATLSGFVLAYAWSAGRRRWPASLALGWAAAAVAGLLAARLHAGLPGATAVAGASILLARAALPSRRAATAAVDLPAWELPARMALTAVLIVAIARAGERFGPTAAGMLAALPILASVLAVFTHARHGPDALVTLLRGTLDGLAGFVSFCALIALVVEPAGVIAAFGLATAAAVLAQLAIARRGARPPDHPGLVGGSEGVSFPPTPGRRERREEAGSYVEPKPKVDRVDRGIAQHRPPLAGREDLPGAAVR
jgi:hypothetical protein